MPKPLVNCNECYRQDIVNTEDFHHSVITDKLRNKSATIVCLRLYGVGFGFANELNLDRGMLESHQVAMKYNMTWHARYMRN